MFASERHRAMSDGTDAGAHEPFLQNADTADGTFIEELPHCVQVGILAFEWKLFLEREYHFLKNLPVRGGVGSIALEVKIQAAAAQLSAEIAKWQKLVGAQQDMHRCRTIGNRFHDIQLVGELPPRCYPPEVL